MTVGLKVLVAPSAVGGGQDRIGLRAISAELRNDLDRGAAERRRAVHLRLGGLRQHEVDRVDAARREREVAGDGQRADRAARQQRAAVLDQRAAGDGAVARQRAEHVERGEEGEAGAGIGGVADLQAGAGRDHGVGGGVAGAVDDDGAGIDVELVDAGELVGAVIGEAAGRAEPEIEGRCCWGPGRRYCRRWCRR